MTIIDTAPRTETAPALEPAPRGNPCILVILGAAGDLTKRKLIPALYNLAVANLLPREFAVVGFARDTMSTEMFRDKMSHDIKEFATGSVDAPVWDDLVKRLYYLTGDFKDVASFKKLQELLEKVDKDHGTHGNYLYYFAIPPSLISDCILKLAETGLSREADGRWRRVIVEKPFGRDLETARALNREIGKVMHESQVYRIDHYLGKETVQNLLAFRFANGIFEPIWNRNYIDHVQITVAETLGVELRGNYYEEAGALRDMVPNHLFQLLSLVAMEPPISFEADSVRDEKAKTLRAVQPLSHEEVLTRTVRGQYGSGRVGSERAPAYRSEVNVSPTSATDTYVALRLKVDNWRWAGVPFYLRTGKRLAKRVTEVLIQFKRAPFTIFRETRVGRLSPNHLVVHIQPKEGISLRFGAKVPGAVVRMADVDMSFNYADFFGQKPSTGYETLLYDCMNGDATLFQRSDNVEAGWDIVQPIIDVWKALTPRSFPNYAAGSWGPPEADELLAREGRAWRKSEA